MEKNIKFQGQLIMQVPEKIDASYNFSEEETLRIHRVLQHFIKLIEGPLKNVSIEEINQKVGELLDKHNFRDKKQVNFSLLTQRETEVLAKLALGHTNKELADQLCINIDTVKSHRKRIKSKLEASSTVDFIKYAKAFDLVL
jgi:DNA-binding CsgD family transcriptional regulator